MIEAVMKFAISRSVCDGKKPCDGAYKDSYVHIDERTVDSPQKLLCDSHTWYERGYNHRVENGHIKRDLDRDGWFIDISDLRGLLELEEKYGNLMIQRVWGNDSILEIEIHDNH